jgi:3-deoxy-D-manno-octulosonate 8-phosphate phosphatase (KDO 8-P phosphatase)
MNPLFSNIKLLLLDVDGVLTDGSIIYSDSGEQIKSFNTQDGLGLKLLMESGIRVGIVTGRSSKALHHRCNNLGIDLIFDNVKDKASVLETILSQTQIAATDMAFMGDDLIDIPIMRKVGLAICVPDAPHELKQCAHIVTNRKGGHGAVREICEGILKAQGRWEIIMKRYLA